MIPHAKHRNHPALKNNIQLDQPASQHPLQPTRWSRRLRKECPQLADLAPVARKSRQRVPAVRNGDSLNAVAKAVVARRRLLVLTNSPKRRDPPPKEKLGWRYDKPPCFGSRRPCCY